MAKSISRLVWTVPLAVLALLGGCGQPEFSDDEKAVIASLSLASLPPLPPDTTNKYADSPAAAALGATLFFDHRPSCDGNVDCATCHKIDRQFQDDIPRAVAVGTNARRTMPLAGVAWNPWFFWDGRRDSLWAQALAPLEDQVEHAGNRTAYARFMARNFKERYERIFGPLPPLEGLPDNAGPFGNAAEQAAWAAMSPQQQNAVNSVFANIGKAIAAFERSLTPPETRFDRFAKALAAGTPPAPADDLSGEERAGLRIFMGKGNCIRCHNGPRFTDGHFHNTGVPSVPGLAPISAARPVSRRSRRTRSTVSVPIATAAMRRAANCASWSSRDQSCAGPTRRRRCAASPAGLPTCTPARSPPSRQWSTMTPGPRPAKTAIPSWSR